MTDIIVAGSMNMDLVVQVERAPEAGETLHGLEFRMIPGGKGANQAAAIGRLGGSVAMVGRVGDDAFGPQLRQSLANLGVDVSLVQVDNTSATGTATIIVDGHGQNRIVVVAGTNGKVSTGDIQAALAKHPAARLLVLQFEIPLDTVETAIRLGRKQGLQVVLNPAPAYPVNDAFLAGVNFLILNESEARLFSGRPVSGVESALQAGRELLRRGPQAVVVTLGAQGAVLVAPGIEEHYLARQVEVVDTTAAGDAFVGAFTLALQYGQSLSDAVKFAVAAGTLKVTRFGAQTGLPTGEELAKFIMR